MAQAAKAARERVQEAGSELFAVGPLSSVPEVARRARWAVRRGAQCGDGGSGAGGEERDGEGGGEREGGERRERERESDREINRCTIRNSDTEDLRGMDKRSRAL